MTKSLAATHKLIHQKSNQYNTGQLNQLVNNLNSHVSEIVGARHNLNVMPKGMANQAGDSDTITEQTTELISNGIQDVNYTNKTIQTFTASITDFTKKQQS